MRIGVVDDFFTMYPVEKRLKRISEMEFEGVQLWLTCVELGFDLSGGRVPGSRPSTNPRPARFPRINSAGSCATSG